MLFLNLPHTNLCVTPALFDPQPENYANMLRLGLIDGISNGQYISNIVNYGCMNRPVLISLKCFYLIKVNSISYILRSSYK